MGKAIVPGHAKPVLNEDGSVSIGAKAVDVTDPTVAQDAATKAYVDVHQTVTSAPTGFPNRTASALSFVSGTRTFTIAPDNGSFVYYIAGVAYTKSSAENIIIANTSGVHVIYYNGATLTDSVNPNTGALHTLFLEKAVVAII